MRVVAAVWVRDGRLLAARRPRHKREGGLWELPGGKVDEGESEAAALERELAEELGVRVRAVERLDASVHVYDHGRIELVAWRVEGPDEPEAREHEALRWVGAADLDALAWAPADLPLLVRVRPLLR